MRSCRRLNMHWLGCVASTLVGMVLGVHLFLMLQDRPLHRTPRNLQMMATEAASAAVAATARGRVGPSTQPPASDEPGGTDLLFVGVMTADQFLDSRAVAVHETWGQAVPGKVKFFTSETSGGPRDLPIVRLRGVTDQYPPQKKSFMMLKHMYENYIDKYEWFMRADDDVYIRMDRLRKFLRGINSSQPMFIGQAGLGNTEEFGRLSLNSKDNYCMGGPGIVMSRTTLALVYPHIRTCLANLYTTHEDVEIGRCVKKYAGVSCLWNYEMREIFYHDQKGTEAFSGSLKYRHILAAMTLHPIKVPTLLYKLHNFFLSQQVQEEQRHKVERYRQVVRSTPPEQQSELSPLTRRLGSPPMLSKLPVTEPEQAVAWSHIGSHFMLHSEKTMDPRVYAAFHLREGVRDATSSLMDYMLSFSQERGRSLSLQELNYGYHRVDPLNGVDMVLDLVLKYIRFRGKRVVQTVRRHAYLQQAFGMPEARSVPRQDSSIVVNVVVAVSGKVKQFQRFCDNLERVGLDGIRVIFVFHENAVPEDVRNATVARLQAMQTRYANAISIVPSSRPFDRASSLMLGASLLTDDDLILFMDVDVLFDHDAVDAVRQSVIKGKQVYFPVVFSQYDPATLQPDEVPADTPPVDERRGKFRYYGFGIAALFRADLKEVGGLNQEIHGWGKEDVDFVDRVLKHPRNYTLMRSAEPGMVHVHHPIVCASDLPADQTVMCKGTLNSFAASQPHLAWQVCRDDRVLQFARSLPKKELKPRTKASGH